MQHFDGQTLLLSMNQMSHPRPVKWAEVAEMLKAGFHFVFLLIHPVTTAAIFVSQQSKAYAETQRKLTAQPVLSLFCSVRFSFQLRQPALTLQSNRINKYTSVCVCVRVCGAVFDHARCFELSSLTVLYPPVHTAGLWHHGWRIGLSEVCSRARCGAEGRFKAVWIGGKKLQVKFDGSIPAK